MRQKLQVKWLALFGALQQWRSAAGGCTERKARMNKRYPKAMCLIILSGMLICFCYPQILKMRCYTVVSGSMSPALPVGAAVYVKEKQPREIKKGEIITFFGRGNGYHSPGDGNR